MFAIQCLDHEEGTGARWFDLKNASFDTREDARDHLRTIRLLQDETCLYSYRITEVGSEAYYAQPTDVLEY